MLSSNLWGPLADGISITLQVALYAFLLGTVLSILSGLAGLSGSRTVRYANQVYVDFFRGTSALVQMFWIFFALPLVGVTVSAMVGGVMVLGLNMGSYGSEVVRGAVLAVDKGQREASVALNLTPLQRMRYVIFPQAVVAMLPPYGNLLIEVMKASALVSLITISDITFEAQKLRVNGAASTTVIFSTALIIYFALALIMTGIIRVLEAYTSRGVRANQRTIRALNLKAMIPWGGWGGNR